MPDGELDDDGTLERVAPPQLVLLQEKVGGKDIEAQLEALSAKHQISTDGHTTAHTPSSVVTFRASRIATCLTMTLFS